MFYWFTGWWHNLNLHKLAVFFFVCFCFEFCHVCPHLHDCYLIFCVGFDVIQKRVFLCVCRHSDTQTPLSHCARSSDWAETRCFRSRVPQRQTHSWPRWKSNFWCSSTYHTVTHTQRLNVVADVLCMCSLSPTRQETVEQLLSNIFDQEKNESAIVSVIQILLTLFETRRPAYVLWPRPLLASFSPLRQHNL